MFNSIKNRAATLFLAVLFIIIIPFSAFAAYNPLKGKSEDLTNLEKSRILLDHFYKSGIDSNSTNDITANKEIVNIMLETCFELTDQEKAELTDQEKQDFLKYFEKLYQISDLDTESLAGIFEITYTEKPVDEIYNTKDKQLEDNIDKFDKKAGKPFEIEGKLKMLLIVTAVIAFSGVLFFLLNKSLKRMK